MGGSGRTRDNRFLLQLVRARDWLYRAAKANLGAGHRWASDIMPKSHHAPLAEPIANQRRVKFG